MVAMTALHLDAMMVALLDNRSEVKMDFHLEKKREQTKEAV